MIAGGTGITPFYQIIQHVLKSESPEVPTLNLIFANRTQGDILLKTELEALAAEGKINLTLTVDKTEEGEE
jgi:NAD(P)H-flavin reductase